jgi:putative DNA methylase
MPLVRSFQLSTKKGKEAWVEPVINHTLNQPAIAFEVKTGEGKAPEGTVNRKGANCIVCNTPVLLEHIRSEGKAGRMDAQLMAIVAEGQSGRVYISPNQEQVRIANAAQPEWKPSEELQGKCRVSVPLYGMTTFGDLFTPRQLLALTTLSDLVTEAREKIKADALAAGIPDDGLALNDGGLGATAYADAVATYLGLAVDRLADYHSNICTWHSGRDLIRNTFARQAIPMTWDFAEANPMSDSTGNFNGAIDWIVQVIKKSSCFAQGKVIQLDATAQRNGESRLISTDPPYYDNIGYADLADFFYVWLRRSLNPLYPDIFSTLLVPKAPELVATPYRFGGDKEKAQSFFEEGLGKAFTRMNEIAYADYPLTVYYAFKQAETEESDDEEGNTVISSTGWETMLEGLIKSDFSIDGTWPMRSELSNRMVASGTNALASSIVLVCRPRPTNAPKATRRQFLNELKSDLPRALKLLQQGNIAPVDLAQASIGPGMAIFSKYTAVLESNGSPMPVRTALQLINQILDEFLTEQEGEFDSDTRWALTWFEQYQFNQGQYGDAETLSKAKNTSVQGMVEAGILEAKAGKVRLLKREDLKADWNPETDARTPVWEVAQQLIHALDQKGETGAAQLLAKLGTDATLARELAYRLYNLCDRKGWTQEGIAYNSLVTSWSEITRLANSSKHDQSKDQLSLF